MKFWLPWILLLPPALALAWAGVIKIHDPAAFQEAILRYQVIPLVPAGLVALWLPWYELLLALAVWWPRLRWAALCQMSVLFMGFSLLLALTWWRGLDMTCGCFGAGSGSVTQTLALDLGLLLCTVTKICLDVKGRI